MELLETELKAYACLAAPDASAERRIELVAKLRGAVERGERVLADTRVARSSSGGLRASLRLIEAGGSTFMLTGPLLADEDADGDAAALVGEALERARRLGARLVRSRPNVDRVGLLYRAALRDHGFVELGERIEFKTEVAELPLDGGTPLRWRDLRDVGVERAAAMLLASAVGDPHGDDEEEDPRAALADWLAAPGLTHGPECVQVGYLEDQAVAFVCAQVSPSDGWSRIAYMGLVPEVRGRGLGAWVHRHGFRMLREQGGTLYHGGTSATNVGMLHLFQKHGCVEVARMLELEWHTPDCGTDGA